MTQLRRKTTVLCLDSRALHNNAGHNHKAERMLNQTIMVATLNTNVEYSKAGKDVLIQMGTRVNVDVESNIALVHSDYIQLKSSDFTLTYLN